MKVDAGAFGMIELQDALLIGVLGAVVFELITLVFRFGLGWTAPERTHRLGRFTGGWRMHHGYPGLLLLIAAPILGFASVPGGHDSSAMLGDPGWWGWVLVAGLTLAVSDLLHHSVVLPLTVGHHEFYLKYPDDTQSWSRDS